MDQVHESNDSEDIRQLLQEIFRLQEMILERMERLEQAVAERGRAGR